MKKTPLILSIFLTFSLQAEDNIFNRANKAYADGKYQEAIILYDSILLPIK